MLALAALAIGGSIWAMHFIAMLAVQIPSVMQYDILVTLVSGLVSILMTAAALAIVCSGVIKFKRIAAAGTVMGGGIATMHYVGMSGMRGNFSLSYETGWLITSVLVGIFASILSLWLVMGLQLRGVLRRLLSAIVMGLSIAGVHYSGMSGTRFESIAQVTEFTQPIFSPFSMGLVTALITFGILGWSLLTLLPNSSAETSVTTAAHFDSFLNRASNMNSDKQQTLPTDAKQLTPEALPSQSENQNIAQTVESESVDTRVEGEASKRRHRADVIPVQRNKKTYFINTPQVASISADGHYSTVRTIDGQSHFCNIGFNKLLNDHPLTEIVRVHRSHAINIDCVISFQRKRDTAVVTLGDDEHEVPVSRSYIANVQNALGLV